MAVIVVVLWLMKRVGGCNGCGTLADEEGRWL